METVNALTTESAIRKIAMAAISIVSYVWFTRKGLQPDSGLINILTETVLPAILTPTAVVVDTIWSRIRQKQADLAKKVAQNSPTVLSDLQLATTIGQVHALKAELPHLSTEEAVAVVSSNKETI